jgi:predicted RND superfamily exporter protein
MLGILGALDWRMTVISSNFVAVLLIITLSIVIHLIVRYRELHAQYPEGELHELVLQSMGLMAVPCFYTSVTTIVAFMSLVVSGIQPVIDFGWMMTVGICIGLLASFIVVPCLMLVWPKGTAHRHTGSEPALTDYFARITDNHGGSILAVTALLVILSIVGISRLEVENRFIDYFSHSTEIYKGMELLDSKLGGTIPLDIIITPPDEEAPLPGLENVPTSPTNAVATDDGFAADDWDDEFDSDEGFATLDDGFKPSYWFCRRPARCYLYPRYFP